MLQEISQTPGPILVPVDFSHHSAAALVWAARLSERIDIPMRVLHVVHDPESEPGYYSRSKSKDDLRHIEDSAAEIMATFLEDVANANDDLPSLRSLEPILIPGIPVTRILEVAARLDASLIVVGSHGRTGLTHLMLGSKAERVAQLSPIPVTIVKLPHDRPTDD